MLHVNFSYTYCLSGGILNILLIFAPFALVSWAMKWSDGITFTFSLLAIAPLAERLGYVTEQLALHTNETVGGLLNATFGNATELIVAITALSKGLYKLVQLSLLGSVLSNSLLVLGTAFFFGGLKYKTQTYGKIASQINAVLLMLSVMALVFPSILITTDDASNLSMLGLSRAISLVLFVLYLLFLLFQLKTHAHLYDDSDSNKLTANDMVNSSSEDVENDMKLIDKEKKEGSDDEEEDILGFKYALVWLTAITILIAFLSDALSSTIENAASGAGISGVFLSAIVLPIVGNAAEHAGAVMFAMKNKVDLTLGVAIGSSTQISLMVLPLLVIIGWMIDKDLDLNFGPFAASTLGLSVITVTFAIKDGKDECDYESLSLSLS